MQSVSFTAKPPIFNKRPSWVHKDIIVPVVAGTAIISSAAEKENEKEMQESLAGNLFVITTWNLLKQQKLPILGPLAAAGLFLRSLEGKKKREKAQIVSHDVIWLSSAMAASKIYDMMVPKIQETSKLIKFVRNLSGFTIGALVVAPYINKVVQHYVIDKFFPEEHENPVDPIAKEKHKANTAANKHMAEAEEIAQAKAKLAGYNKVKT